jgi:hypothetical protein
LQKINIFRIHLSNEWNNEIIKEYIRQTSCKIIVNKLQMIGIESIHIKWMNEIIKNYIRQTSCKIIVNKLHKVLTYVICRQWMKCHIGISFATLECVWEYDVDISCK